jgi:hypothetical protein
MFRHRYPLIEHTWSVGTGSGCCRSSLGGERDRSPLNDAVGILALGDLDRAVCRDVMEGLANSAGGPVYFQGGYRHGLPQSDGGIEAIAAEARSVADDAVARFRLTISGLDLGPQLTPMAARLDQVPTSLTLSQWLSCREFRKWKARDEPE